MVAAMQWAMAHYRRLEKLLRRRGRTREEAEDLIQETFLRVKVYLDQGKEIREPEAFLVRTALNLSQDTRLHERRHLYARQSVEDLFLIDKGPGPDEVLEAEQRLRQLQLALDRASSRARDVFLMNRLYGMSYEQIADHFDLSVSAIEKHMAKAWSILGREVLRNDAE